MFGSYPMVGELSFYGEDQQAFQQKIAQQNGVNPVYGGIGFY